MSDDHKPSNWSGRYFSFKTISDENVDSTYLKLQTEKVKWDKSIEICCEHVVGIKQKVWY